MAGPRSPRSARRDAARDESPDVVVAHRYPVGMAPLPVIANTFRCTLEWSTFAGVSPVNVLHFRSDSLTDSEVGLNLAGAIDVNSDALAFLSLGYSLENIAVIKLDGTSGTVRPVLEASPAGQSGGAVVPETAMVTTFATGARGPQGRGRIYIGPGTETHINEGIIDIDTGAVADAWSEIAAAMALVDAEHVVASYVHAIARPVISYTSHSYCATQRKRLLQTRG